MIRPRPEWGPLHLSDRREAYYVHKNHGTDMGGEVDPSMTKKTMHIEEGIPMNGHVPLPTSNGVHLNGAVGGAGSTV